MKRIALTLIFMTAVLYAVGQQKAVTEKGDEVILYENGTWRYVNEDASPSNAIPTNPTKFVKPSGSSFLLKSKRVNVGFWLNPRIWSFQKAEENADAEYELQLKNEDLYGMVIAEKVEIPLTSLRSIAIENAKSVAPDLRIVKEEYRIVNGLKVLLLQMNGTMEGIKFTYYGYYYSNENGTVQFITYTAQNLMKSYRNECEDLLNGLVEIR